MRAMTCMPRFLAAAQQSPKKSRSPRILAFPVERHLGLVERQDAGDADQHGVDLQAGPVVGPLLDVEDRGVVLGHVELPDAPHLSRPRNNLHRVRVRGARRRDGVCESGGSWEDEELATADIHGHCYTAEDPQPISAASRSTGRPRRRHSDDARRP